MNQYIEEKHGLFALHTDHTSYLFQVDGYGHLEHIHYGRRVSISDAEALSVKQTLPYGTVIEYEDNVCQSFFKATNRNDTLKIHSYELKKEITTDYELKKCFFQAVSNSSWANYSYLVAFKISDNLLEELERLNNSFGIGFIQLNSNPEKSRIMFSPKDKQLDFKTVERLCNINPDFKVFIKQIEKIITASDKYVYDVKKGLIDICDKTFETEAEALNYCKYKNII